MTSPCINPIHPHRLHPRPRSGLPELCALSAVPGAPCLPGFGRHGNAMIRIAVDVVLAALRCLWLPFTAFGCPSLPLAAVNPFAFNENEPNPSRINELRVSNPENRPNPSHNNDLQYNLSRMNDLPDRQFINLSIMNDLTKTSSFGGEGGC